MHHSVPFAASILSALLVAGPAVVAVAPALAGEAPAAEAPGENATNPAAGGDATARAHGAHLDALFAELADPANAKWENTQAQIYAAWAESGSASMDLLAERADRAMQAQDLETALSFLDDLVRLDPGYAEGWNKRATVHFLREEYGKALQDIARTLTLEPRHFGAYAGLGIILDRLGDKKGALEAYRRAAEIHPHLPGAAEGIRKLTREVEGERT
jgi:tetratricopeptide (TPR) repeat protein